MTDIFEEQLAEDELYSSLAPPEEKPDPIGELVGALGDIGQAGLDIAGAVLKPRWPPWGTDREKEIATTLKDFIGETGKFAPPPEPEELTTEDLLGQRAQELMPSDKPTDKAEGEGTGILKALHFEQMTDEGVFVKWINWLRRSGVRVAARSGAPLGEATIYEESGRVSPAWQVQGTAESQASIIPLSTDAGQKFLTDYLRANWRNTPDLLELVQQNVASNWAAFTAATVDGKRPETFGTPEEDPDVFGDLMRQFGGYGDGTTILADVDDAFGGGSAAAILGGTVDAAVTAYAAELSKGDRSMMLGPALEGEDVGVGGQVGWITSFDGSPYGDIESVNDLFSGGRLGDLNAYPYMSELYRNTMNSQGYSPLLEQLQQELFAWGILDSSEGFEWGKLDVIGMEGGADRTVDALQMYQADIANTALQVPESELASDATPYMDAVLQRLIGRNVNATDLDRNSIRDREQQILKNVSERIQERIKDNPGRTINTQGIKELEVTIQEMLGGLGSQEREQYFGRGGSALERQLVDNLMADFYGESDWGSQIFFGGQNSDIDFLNYAKGVGALTTEQMSLMTRGAASPENFRENWSPDDTAALQAAEKDVVTSNLLKYIANNTTGDQPDVGAIRKGLITFAHTIGQRTAMERNYSDVDYGSMAQRAIDAAMYSPVESPLVTTLDDRLAESMNLVGGENTPDFRKLMDSLNNRRKSVNTLRVRNV